MSPRALTEGNCGPPRLSSAFALLSCARFAARFVFSKQTTIVIRAYKPGRLKISNDGAPAKMRKNSYVAADADGDHKIASVCTGEAHEWIFKKCRYRLTF
jgi:hypothetical protein